MKQRKVYKISEITSLIKGNLESLFGDIWLEGEVSNFAAPMSGHYYLTLKDSEAQIRAVIFKYVNQFLKFKIENGLQLVCRGKITVYAPRGEYQLVVTHVEPKGVGALQLAFEQLKKKLAKEGLFKKEDKKELPLLPKRIGVVTSATGAAIRDILHVLERRFRNPHVLLIPVRVQGEGSAIEIAEAIDMFNRYGKIDVMIVGRGGGSLEDLWAFNEEVVARAIFASKIPVVSAVGHEVDFTISDFVADLRAPTPSAAAEMVVSRRDYLEEQVAIASERMQQSVFFSLERYQKRLENAKESYFFKQPKTILETPLQAVDYCSQMLLTHTQHKVKETQHRLNNVFQKLEVLNPLKVLARGYSVSFNAKNQVISSIADVQPAETLTTRLRDGMVYSEVLKVEKN